MLRILAIILFAILLPLQAAAQTQPSAVALPDPLTPESVRELVSTLSDADARKLLVEVLDKLGEKAPAAEAEQVELSFAAAIREAATGVASSVVDTLARAPNVVSGLSTAVSNFVATHGLQAIGATIAVMLFSIALGAAAEAGVNRFTGKWHDRIDRAKAPDSLAEMLRMLVMRLLVDLGGLIVFFIVLRVVNTNFIAAELRPFAHEFIFSLIVVPRAAAAFTRLLISPNNPEWRLVKTDDWTAAFMMRQQTGVIAFMGLGAFLISFQVDNGVPLGTTRLGAWLTLVAFLWLAYIVWRARAGLSEMMAGWEPVAQ